MFDLVRGTSASVEHETCAVLQQLSSRLSASTVLDHGSARACPVVERRVCGFGAEAPQGECESVSAQHMCHVALWPSHVEPQHHSSGFPALILICRLIVLLPKVTDIQRSGVLWGLTVMWLLPVPQVKMLKLLAEKGVSNVPKVVARGQWGSSGLNYFIMTPAGSNWSGVHDMAKVGGCTVKALPDLLQAAEAAATTVAAVSAVAHAAYVHAPATRLRYAYWVGPASLWVHTCQGQPRL